MVKKAQNGTKATKDSTKYFKDEKELRYDLAITQAKFGLPKAAKENAKKAVQAINNGARQAYKGKPGFDANGYPEKKMGGMIKRADGSTSQRGLWDNIRANKGSVKKPTSAMLKQEKKIKAKKAQDGTSVRTTDVGETGTGNMKVRLGFGKSFKEDMRKSMTTDSTDYQNTKAKTTAGKILRGANKVASTVARGVMAPVAATASAIGSGVKAGVNAIKNKQDLKKIPEKKMGGKVAPKMMMKKMSKK